MRPDRTEAATLQSNRHVVVAGILEVDCIESKCAQSNRSCKTAMKLAPRGCSILEVGGMISDIQIRPAEIEAAALQSNRHIVVVGIFGVDGIVEVAGMPELVVKGILEVDGILGVLASSRWCSSSR